jgi:hypothetical protein
MLKAKGMPVNMGDAAKRAAQSGAAFGTIFAVGSLFQGGHSNRR